MVEVSFGEWLKRQRGGRGLTQEQLAHQIGCATITLRKIESEERHPSEQIVERLSEIFNIPQKEQTNFLHFARGDWTKAPSEIGATPWRTSTKPKNNLPAQLTSFIGREKELKEVQEAINSHRLVTLTGSGGTGKTRLSLQVAEGLLKQFDYIWFVELAPITDPNNIPQTILSAIGLSEQQGKTTLELISGYLQDKKTLIVLDNCEHLIDVSAKISYALLDHIPELKILASSREALGVKGEMAWHVPSLSLPDINHLPEFDQLVQYEAIRLFTERATLAKPNFTVTKENAPSIAQICSRLDGIPLALELAASRIKALSVEQIAARLDDRFRLLTGGSRTALPRQQTLRATIDWSYSLLTESERALFHHLTVFSGGWTLEAAESICSQEGGGVDILDLLTQLVDKSLVNLKDSRYRMLETTRQYAREKLLDSSKGQVLHDKHLNYFLDLAKQADKEIHGPNQMKWINHLEDEHDNFRAALSWCVSNHETESALRLLTRLSETWLRRDHSHEILNWLNMIRVLPGIMDYPLLYARLLNRISEHSWLLGDLDYAKSLLEESQAMLIKLGVMGEPDLAMNLCWLGMVERMGEEDHQAAQPFYARSLELYQKHGDPWGMAFVMFNLGVLADERNEDRLALSLFEQSMDIFRRLGDKWGIARVSQMQGTLFLKQRNFEQAYFFLNQHLVIDEEWQFKQGMAMALYNMGNFYRYQGDCDQSEPFYEKMRNVSREYDSKMDEGLAYYGLGLIALHRNDYRQAAQYFKDYYSIHRSIVEKWATVDLLYASAAISAGTNQSERAMRLYGAAQALLESSSYHFSSFDLAEFERHIQIAREQLGDAKFEVLAAEGRAMPMEQAIAYALDN